MTGGSDQIQSDLPHCGRCDFGHTYFIVRRSPMNGLPPNIFDKHVAFVDYVVTGNDTDS